MGEPGIKTVAKVLPKLKSDNHIDIVVAQAENVSSGKGINQKDYKYLQSLGIDFFTGGNWSINDEGIHSALNNEDEPIIRPANYPEGTIGKQYKYLKTAHGDILFVSLLGKIVGRDADLPMDNPLKAIDEILEKEKDHSKIAVVVNFHGDYSSEKVVIGHYLDGRVSAVIGDHWHVPTADYRVLPNGTAHVTDVGMVGSLNSSLGIKLDIIYKRWRDEEKLKNELEETGPMQFNALVFEVDADSMMAKSVERIYLEL
jgi:metallophosphoesterase (TIGR00282 family)